MSPKHWDELLEGSEKEKWRTSHSKRRAILTQAILIGKRKVATIPRSLKPDAKRSGVYEPWVKVTRSYYTMIIVTVFLLLHN